MTNETVAFNFGYTNIRSISTSLVEKLIPHIEPIIEKFKLLINDNKKCITDEELFHLIISENNHIFINVSSDVSKIDPEYVNVTISFKYRVDDQDVIRKLGLLKYIDIDFVDDNEPDDLDISDSYLSAANIATIYFHTDVREAIVGNYNFSYSSLDELTVDNFTLNQLLSLQAIVELIVRFSYTITDPIRFANYCERIISSNDNQLVEETIFDFVYCYHL